MKRFLFVVVCCFVATMAMAQCDTLMVKQAREAVKSKDYVKGLELFLQADKTFTPDTTDCYGNLQHNIGYCYYMMGDKRKAAVHWEKALSVFPQFSDKHGQLLEFLASIYDDLGDKTNLKRILKLTQVHNEHELTKPMTTIKDYLDRAQFYGVTGEAAKAKDLYLQVIEKVKDGTAEEKENVYSAYAKYLSNNKDRQGAADYYLLSAAARKETKGEDRQWALTMYLAALNRQLQCDWLSAYEVYEKASKTFATNGDEKYVRNCMSSMGTCMYFLQNYDKAKTFYEKVLKSLETEKQTADYAKSLRNVAKADVKLKLFEEALRYLQAAADIYEKLGDNANLQTALTELNSAKVKAGQNFDENIDQRVLAAAKAQSKQILDEERKNLPLYKIQFGENGINYVRSLGLVAELTYALEDKTKGVELYENYLKKYRTALRTAFVLQDEKERQQTWQEETMTLDSLVVHTCGYDSTTINLSARLNAMAYDVQLLSKGVLLNSSIEFEHVVESYGDKQLKDDYARIKELKKEIERLQNGNGTEDNLEKLSQLRQESDRMMLSLMQRCKEMSDFTEYLDYTWSDVRDALGEKDVAIEFAEIKNGTPWTNNVIVAYVLTKSIPAPICIPICLRGYASIIAKDSTAYINENYGALIWGNIFQMINGCERVYFSPTAELSNLGIEYMMYQGKPMIDHCEMFRLSSTKELCRKHEPLSLKHVALFGDIDYGANGQTKTVVWRHTDVRSGQETEESSGIINFNPLHGTGREIKEIGKLLKSAKSGESKAFQGNEASEQTLRGLSGDKQLDVLHIATHGQYYGNRRTTEAEAMQCSMLAFSGVNLPNDDESTDGIVTAQDIAFMNFRHCGMAVLSACETGLGKFGSDGVFGLQRGFKNAGVHTLLMSIAKVNDAATTELMIQFYKALANGNITPNAALRQAQQYLRANGYDNPRLWASFIILDGQ